jgi:hypothetical protein
MFRSVIVLLCLLTMPLRANMGETVAQCVARYGKPVGFSEASATNPFGTLAFTAADYTLIVFLLDGKEVGARVSKRDKSAFTDAEMQTIMSADSAGTPWTSETSDDPACLQWGRADKATALYDKAKHVLIFTSQEMADAIQAKPPATSKPPITPAPAATSAPPAAPSGN